jgi:HrpA-like RNA helicase
MRLKIDWPKDNSWLAELPVSKALASHAYNLNENFCLVAATGSGKTMVIGPAIKMTTGRKVIIRQPTRQIAWLVYSSLKKFWGDSLAIGIRTSEKTIGNFDDNDITVVTDGVMRSALQDANEGITVIFDEAHWMHEPTEIELGIVKTYMNQGVDVKCVLLSATIRPDNFLTYFENLNPEEKRVGGIYIDMVCDKLLKGSEVNEIEQKQFMKCYYAEGVLYSVQKHITHTNNQTAINQFVDRIASDNKRGLVFLTTRNEVSQQKDSQERRMTNKDIAFEFCHADRNIDEIVNFVNDNETSVLFSTVSMATSATLPFDEVLIIDRGLESDWSGHIPSLKTNVPIDSNGIIQRAGRVGRTKPGVAFLNTMHKPDFDILAGRFSSTEYIRTNWDDIQPEPIKPPLESLPLDMVVLTCAAFKMNLRDIDLLSNLVSGQIISAAKRMEEKGIINFFDGGDVELTNLGTRINSMQMGVWPAYALCMTRGDMTPAYLASLVVPTPFGLFDKGGLKKWSANHKRYKSIATFKASVLKEAFAQKRGKISSWAEENGLRVKAIRDSMKSFRDLAKKSLNTDANKLSQTLIDTDLSEIDEKMVKHIGANKLQERYSLNYSERWGFNTNIGNLWAVCSEDETELLNIPYGSYATVFASPKKITTKAGKPMIILEGLTVVSYR